MRVSAEAADRFIGMNGELQGYQSSRTAIHIVIVQERKDMTFDIHQRVLNADGMPRERIAGEYQGQLMELFVESPEGQELRDEGLDGGWANMMMDYGMSYLGVTPPQMTPAHLRELLFDIFPRKVSAEADEAPDAIRELQAFWKFVQREFQLKNAAVCLEVLDDKAVGRFKKEMSNPANFGMAKSIVMKGKARGFDMATEEGLNAWMMTYSAELATGRGQRPPLFGGLRFPWFGGLKFPWFGGRSRSAKPIVEAKQMAALPSGQGGSAKSTARAEQPLTSLAGRSGSGGKTQDKTKRKMVRSSQRKNRKKK